MFGRCCRLFSPRLALVPIFSLLGCSGPAGSPPDLSAIEAALPDRGQAHDRAPLDARPADLARDGYPPEPPPIWLLHISDPHIGFSAYSSQALSLTLGEVIPAVGPTLIVNSGDTTDSGLTEQWTTYNQLIKGKLPPFPTYFEVPGNHDLKADDGKSYLAGSQTGKAGGGFFGISYLDLPTGRLQVVRTNTADTNINARAVLGYFGESQRDELYKLPPSPVPIDRTIVVGHHPIKGLQALQVLGTDGRMEDVLQHFGAALYLCGHVHTGWLSFSKKTLVVQVPTLGKPSSIYELGFAVEALSSSGPAARIVSLAKGTPAVSWPLALITSPADLKLGGGNPHAKTIAPAAGLRVRALGFAPSKIQKAELRVDEGPWQSMTSADQRLWEALLTAPEAAGHHTLEVRVASDEGTNSHAITISVGS